MAPLLFDDSLPQLVETLTRLAGHGFVKDGTALRDVSGRLSFVADRAPRNDDERERLAQALIESLGSYARTDGPLRFRGDGGTEAILTSLERLPVQVGG
ncbi:MAG: hypothetical protein ACREFZ_08495, partial [Acetobacteraceae bacterium]